MRMLPDSCEREKRGELLVIPSKLMVTTYEGASARDEVEEEAGDREGERLDSVVAGVDVVRGVEERLSVVDGEKNGMAARMKRKSLFWIL